MRSLVTVLILAAVSSSFAAVPKCALDPKATDCSQEVLGRLPNSYFEQRSNKAMPLEVVPDEDLATPAADLASRRLLDNTVQWEAFHAEESLFRMREILNEMVFVSTETSGSTITVVAEPVLDDQQMRDNLREFANEFDTLDEHVTEIVKILNQCANVSVVFDSNPCWDMAFAIDIGGDKLDWVRVSTSLNQLRSAYQALNIDAVVDDISSDARKISNLVYGPVRCDIMGSLAMRDLEKTIDYLSQTNLQTIIKDTLGGSK